MQINLQERWEEFPDIIYCFQVILNNGQILYLTEQGSIVEINNIQFLPNSGLSVVRGEFNDSAQNYIILEGIFEVGGIEQDSNLNNCSIQIISVVKGEAYHFVTYYCSSYVKQDLSFTIHLQSEAGKYNKSILHSFSKTCRANFGDAKCGINKKLYSNGYIVKEIFGKTIILLNLDKENGYYTGGEVIFENNLFSSKIIGHFGEAISLEQIIPDQYKHIETVTLFVGCDKNFISCCNKFNNAVNFRGEPVIPDNNLIKI